MFLQGHDAGVYRCRADFYRAPTTINHMRLDVIGNLILMKCNIVLTIVIILFEMLLMHY